MGSHAYPQTGAGPSSYYQQSPPPHHVYGNHSPGPRPNYHYSYPVPPPHLNSHQPPQFQQSPSRANHRHNVGGGGPSYASRATHHYNNYHPTQHHQFIQSHVSPQLGPHPQQQQHIPYSPQSAKYNHTQPYSPSYHYPSPTAPVFTPSWQTQQPISPLPKQLSMPPPQNVQAFYEPALEPSPGLTQSPQMPVISIVPSSENEIKTEPPAPSTPTPGSPVQPTSSPPPESLAPSQMPYTSTYSQMGTISTSDAVTSVSPPSSPRSLSYVSPPRRTVANPVAQWAIWSRRPQDPSHAPSIIISPRARPPPDVVQQAIDLKTPPQSQPSSPSRSATILPAVVGGLLVVIQEGTTSGTSKDEENSPTPQPSEDADLSSSVTSPSVVWSSQTSSTVPSSSVTEITDTPTVPGSPASSNTSLSLAGISLKDIKEPQTKSNEETAKAIVAEPASQASSSPFVVSLSTSAMSTAVSSSTIVSGFSASLSTVTSHDGLAATADPTPIQTSTPTPIPPAGAPSAPAPIKKSWADLLRPSTSSTPSSSAFPSSGPTIRNTLPTSSVVGFSIPAGSTSASSSSNPTVPVSPSEKSELITLLTSGPDSNSTTAGTNIRPRGIVNSGNMCYANSVLQVLVYCLPFQRLFVELGKVLPGTALVDSSLGSLVNGFGFGSSSTSVSGSASALVNGLNGKEKEATGMTPLVDATVEFLGEFMDDKKTKSRAKKQVHSKKGPVHVNGNGSNTSGAGSKGKEKEMRGLPNGSADGDSEADWDPCDSFLPTYVYDAMKLKKRFDHMKGGHQEDAEEFFGFYLETLEEELLSLLHAVNPPKSTKNTTAVEEKEEAAPPEDDGWMEVGKRNRTIITRMIKATESPITRIFSGRFRTTVRAPGQKDSATVDDWNLLRLDIQRDHIHTIQDALSSISHPQSVQLSQSARPGIIIEGQQQSLIEILPPILVLQMKRFGYGSTGVAKVGKQVRFGPELEIGPDLMVPAAKKAHPQRYKLFGALYHHGLSASGGHYTLDVLHPNRYPGSANAKTREGWVRIDDELVSDVRHEDVFGAYERDDARCAYLLFYRRV